MTDRAAIYRNAARFMEKGGSIDSLYSCTSIEAVGGTRDDERAYVDLYSPKDLVTAEISLQLAFGQGEDPEARNHRIMALCFMAAMVEDGDA